MQLHDIHPNQFKTFDELPKFSPLSRAYIDFWRTQKQLCIEGVWSNGFWMPGKLYFYITFGTIKLNVNNSKVKSFGRPLLRDLEWEFFLNWEEARGFSGFEQDEFESCSRVLKDFLDEDIQPSDFIRGSYPNIIKPDGTFKKYVPARDYMRRWRDKPLGAGLYDNNSLNLMMIGSRGFGKSYSVGVGVVAHEYLFDGKTRYTVEPTSSEVVVGAGDAKYSGETLDKTKIAIEQLPGEIKFADRVYPSPFFKRYSGSWTPAKQITNVYEKKIGGQWTTTGTLSNIKHRTFKDNPFAANGTRPGVMIFEEVGFFENLKETYAASVECQRDGATKFGSMMFTGTGGYDSGLSGLASQEMFYNPNDYEMLTFEDHWENRGKIGYFVPAYLGLNDFKNSSGFTDVESAKKFLEKHRDKLRKSKGGMTALESEIINRPVVPSEIFLEKRGNVFPVMELRARLEKLEQANSYAQLAKKVDLYFEQSAPNGVNYAIDVSNNLQAIDNFPWKSKDREGCVVIYEFPAYVDNKIPQGAYLIGHDPYATDDESGESLAATIVLKTKKAFNSIGHDEIVAVYYGRPYQGRHIVNENLYKLSLFYGNAKIYFENVRGNVKEYFEKIRRLDLLAKQPTTVLNKKAAFSQSPSVVYGYPMSSQGMKIEAMHYIRDWLLEERQLTGEGEDAKMVRNLDYIWDKKLLQELIMFNMDGNFDACFLPGTEVLTDEGPLNIEDIKPLHQVTTLVGDNYPVVFNHKNPYDGEIIDIKINGSGDYISSTPNHEFWTASNSIKKHNRRKSLDIKQWKRADELALSDFLLIPKRKLLPPSKLGDELLYLLGWYLGDGYIANNTNTVKYTLSLKEKHTAEILVKYLDKYEGKKARWELDKNSNCIRVIKTSKELTELIRYYCGSPNNKFIHKDIFMSSDTLPFVLGFMEAEGCQQTSKKPDGYIRNTITCSNTNIKALKQIRQILIDNGIYSTICKVKTKDECKEQKCISIQGKYINLLAATSNKFYTIPEKEKYIKSVAIEKEEGFWVPIKNLSRREYAGNVYNLSVLNENTYTVNTVAVHNCMALAGAIVGLQETHNQYQNTLIQTSQPDVIKNEIDRFIVNNKSLFKNLQHVI